jgi:hypothetical protein
MEQTRRVNAAIDLLRRDATPGEVVSSLVCRFEISMRQAHRYLQRAQTAAGPLSLPESKEVFTVKLPSALIQEVRFAARRSRRPISDLTAEALRAFLRKKAHG